MRDLLPLLLLAGCQLHDAPFEDLSSVGRPDAAVVPDGAAGLDAAADADVSPCDALPEPLVEWIFDREADPRAPVPDRALAEPNVTLFATVRDPWGVRFGEDGAAFDGGRLEADVEEGRELGEAVADAGALTIEVWASTPQDDNGGPARIVTYSSGAFTRAFSIMQEGDALETRLRTTATDDNGTGLGFALPGVFPSAAPRQIVLTFDGAGGVARLYTDGALRSEELHADGGGAPGALAWDVSRERFGCGDEFLDGDDGSRVWRGTLHSVRVWSTALDETQVGCRFLP